MARVLMAFYNGVEDPTNSNALPAYYEAFVNGLDEAGNEVAVISHRLWGEDFCEIDENTAQTIRNWNPDICFIFNNSFYDVSNIVSCPIVIYEADSPRYFSNKDAIKKNPDRYLYFIGQEDDRETLKIDYGVKDSNIYYVPPFSEVRADDNVNQTTNISFIGTLFASTSTVAFDNFIKGSPSKEECEMMKNVLNHLRKNSQVTPTELVYKYNITSELVARSMNLRELLMALSAEHRIKVLSAVSDLGLDLYGTKNWQNAYYFNMDLNMAYIDKLVYSLKHTQDIYNSSKIGINVSHYQANSGFPWRVTDIMASNACLVSEHHSDFIRAFGNIPIPTYESEAEAREVCKRLLGDESRRRDIVLQCQEVINAKYRFKNLLLKLEEYSGVVMHI